MLIELAIPFAAAVLLSLDRRAFMQTMLGRPLVVGTVVGWTLSEPLAGLSLGLWTELLWLWRLTSGGYYTPNTPLALSAVLIALFGAGAPGPADWQAKAVMGLAMIPCLAQLLIRADVLLRRVAGRRSSRLRGLFAGLESRRGCEAPAEGGPEGAGDRAGPGDSGASAALGDSGGQGGRAAAHDLAPRAFRRAALAGLAETLAASAMALALMIPAVRLFATVLVAGTPDSFWVPVAAFAPYAPAAGLLGIAASLSPPYLSPYILGALCALLALSLFRLLG
ncbi:MAG: hypothetical protein LBR80_06045 [Deltaproteobacteria bacterium]|jgi:hypothetical protein|nr:hypothetical protein [Deltaproteobacteria bacterium]